MLLSSLSVVAIMMVIRFSLPPVVEALSVSSMPRHEMIAVVVVIALVAAVALAIAVGHVPHAVHSTRPWVGSSTRPVVAFARLRACVIS